MDSTDPEELEHYWVQWYNHAGKPTRRHFDKYIELKNESAILNSKSKLWKIWLRSYEDYSKIDHVVVKISIADYTDAAEEWLHEYEDPTFEQQLYGIFDEIRPFYQQLHAYVRYKLNEKYGDIVPGNGSIPMHLLGNMWAQSWENVS